MQLLKIQINHNNLYRHTLIYVSICFSSLFIVYILFGIYFFVVLKVGGITMQYISYVTVNAALILLAIQYQLFVYSMYMRFSTLNEFVE